MANLFKALKYTLAFEGGYSDDPDDHGGKTYCGITQTTLNRYLKNHPSSKVADSVKDLSIADVEEISGEYWKFDDVTSQPIASKLFDMAFNMGLHQAIVYCQRILGLQEDGFFGPVTLSAVNGCDPTKLMNGLVTESISHYLGCIKKDPTQEKYRKGWLRRATSKPNN